MSEFTLGLLFVTITGLGWGSFATMAIYRMPRGIPWIGEKPFCPNCKIELTFIDYISLLSFFIYKGKCRHCGKKYQHHLPYFCTELSILFFFIISYLHHGLNTLFLLHSALIITGTIAAIIDAEHKKIPEKVIINFTIFALLYRSYIDQGDFYGLMINSLIATIIGILIRQLYFTAIGKPKIAKDYLQRSNIHKFSGPGFDNIKIFVIASLYLPLDHFIVYFLLALIIVTLWYLLNKQTLRIGTILIYLLIPYIIYIHDFDSFLLYLLNF